VLSLFSLSADATQIAAKVLPSLSICCCLIWPLSFAFPNVLRAAGDARYTMIVSASTMWIVRFGLSYLLIKVFHFGLEGVWYCMMIDWFVRAAFFYFRYRGGKWQTMCVLR
jgi:Na+-driven multidrug efflux pump